MNYKLDITINAPIDKVAKLFNNSRNYKYWQPELIDLKQLSGSPGKKGSKIIMSVKIGSKKVKITETIIKEDLPEEISFIYEAKGAWNENRNYFIKIKQNKTKWVQENVFRCKGFLRIIAFFMPGIFKKDSIKHMKMFKEFVEKK